MKKKKSLLLAITCIFTLLIGSVSAFAEEESYTDTFEFKINTSSDGFNSGVVNKVSGRTFARAVITGVYKIAWYGKGAETNAVTNFIVISGNGTQISANNTASNHQSFSMKYYDSAISYYGATYLRGNSTVASPKYYVEGSWSPNQYQ